MKKLFKVLNLSIRKISIEVKLLKLYLLAEFVFLFIAYFSFLIFDDNIIEKLFREDGLFEYFGATFLLISSLIFMLIFYFKKHIMLLLFFLIFFFSFGEEISWGQRMLMTETTVFFKKHNVQNEINIHNLDIFSITKSDIQSKNGIYKLINSNVLFKLFCLFWCVLLPITYANVDIVRVLVSKIKIPVPPISIGFFFLINFTIYFAFKYYLIQSARTPEIIRDLQEASEFAIESFFMILSVYFLMNEITMKK
jgi:hypothetical protein